MKDAVKGMKSHRLEEVFANDNLIESVCSKYIRNFQNPSMGFPHWLSGKESTSAGDTGLIPGLGRSHAVEGLDPFTTTIEPVL